MVTLAGLTNSLKLIDKKPEDCSVVISGMGAAGLAIGKILRDAGYGELIGVDSTGSIYSGRDRLNLRRSGSPTTPIPTAKPGRSRTCSKVRTSSSACPPPT